jgi:hypothetical protein
MEGGSVVLVAVALITTADGRLVHRFWRGLCEEGTGRRGIPLTSLQTIVGGRRHPDSRPCPPSSGPDPTRGLTIST